MTVITVEGLVLCDECTQGVTEAGETCSVCGGKGYIEDFGEIDQEDVA